MTALEIDGTLGEGGGQILRTSLALSLITGTPFRMRNLRQARSKPGLRRQHLTALRAAARIGNAEIEGDVVGSRDIAFTPGGIEGGRYEFDVGTAGSTTLVFQTVLPALLQCSVASTMTLTGGTHNHGGAPCDFIETVFLPALRRMGAHVSTQFERYGFAPAIRAALSWRDSAYRLETVESAGPGKVVMISGSFGCASELSTGLGQRGVRAERVAADALDCWNRYDQACVPVGEHLADQLLLPMAIARGVRMLTAKPAPYDHQR